MYMNMLYPGMLSHSLQPPPPPFQACLRKNPATRPTSEGLLQHPFFLKAAACPGMSRELQVCVCVRACVFVYVRAYMCMCISER